MAMIFMDSLHGYNDTTEIRTNQEAVGTFSLTGAGQISEPYQECSGTSEIAIGIPNADGSGPKTLFLAFWGWFDNSENTHEFIRMLDTGNTRQGGFFISDSGRLEAIRSNNTVVASQANAIQPKTWFFWESKYRVDNTTGDYIVKINGEEVLRSTGVDSQGTSDARIRQVVFENETGNTTRISHLWIWDDSGSVHNNFIGPRRLVQLFPSGDGGLSNWDRSSTSSTNWQLIIDDPVTSTDYISATSTGTADRYQFDNLSTNVNAVTAVQVNVVVNKTDGNAQLVEPFIESTGTEENGRAEDGLDGRNFIQHIFPTDPNGGGAWTVSALNTARVGVRLVASTN